MNIQRSKFAEEYLIKKKEIRNSKYTRGKKFDIEFLIENYYSVSDMS